MATPLGREGINLPAGVPRFAPKVKLPGALQGATQAPRLPAYFGAGLLLPAGAGDGSGWNGFVPGSI